MDAYQMGYDAYWAGYEDWQNPFSDDFTCFGYEDWEDWDAGWWEAFDEDCSM